MVAKKEKVVMFKEDISGRIGPYRSPILKGSTNLVASRSEMVEVLSRDLLLFCVFPAFNQLRNGNSGKEVKVKIRFVNSLYFEVFSEPYIGNLHKCYPFKELSLMTDALNRLQETGHATKEHGFWTFSTSFSAEDANVVS